MKGSQETIEGILLALWGNNAFPERNVNERMLEDIDHGEGNERGTRKKKNLSWEMEQKFLHLQELNVTRLAFGLTAAFDFVRSARVIFMNTEDTVSTTLWKVKSQQSMCSEI